MAKYEVTVGGQKYEVEAPDEQALHKAVEGLTQSAAPAETPQQPSVGADVAKSAASGLAQGTLDLAGTPGTISNALNAGFGAALKAGYRGVTGAANYLQGEGFTPETPAPGSFFGGNAVPASVGSGEVIRDAASAVTGGATEYEPQTTVGEYAQTGASFVPGAVAFGGLSPSNIVKYGIAPGLASEGAGQATKGTAAEPYARIGAALLAPAAIAGTQRLITPFANISPERQAMVDVLKSEGVPLSAGQKTGSKGLQYRESELGGGAAQTFNENQAEAFTGAVLKRAGIDAKRATPEVIDGAYTRLGQQFDDLATRNNVIPDAQLGADIGDTFRGYNEIVSSANKSPIVEKLVGDITTQATKGPISGAWYQKMSSDIAKRARETTDGTLKTTLLDLRSSLDDAMERSIAVANPDDLGAFRETRNQYRNLLAITKAATGVGENAAAGLISPSAIRNAAVSQGRSAYARGQGDFAELARAGEGTMKPLPDSGTSSRLMARGAGTGVGAGIGAAIGGIPGAAVGAVAGQALPAVLGRAILSKAGRAYLGNQLITENGLTAPGTAAVIESLIARGLLPTSGGQ